MAMECTVSQVKKSQAGQTLCAVSITTHTQGGAVLLFLYTRKHGPKDLMIACKVLDHSITSAHWQSMQKLLLLCLWVCEGTALRKGNASLEGAGDESKAWCGCLAPQGPAHEDRFKANHVLTNQTRDQEGHRSRAGLSEHTLGDSKSNKLLVAGG